MKTYRLLALLAALLLLGSTATANACEWWDLECNGSELDDGDTGDSSSDDGDTSDGGAADEEEEQAVEEPVEQTVGPLALPAAASARGVESSARGIATANEARQRGQE